MGVFDFARDDIKDITSDLDGFGIKIELFDRKNETSHEVVGTRSRHHLGIDEEGVMVSDTNAHISISEPVLLEAGVQVRDANNECRMLQFAAKFQDSNGIERWYVVREQFPDDAVGLIVMILGEAGGDEFSNPKPLPPSNTQPKTI